jgi:hypothetical protein
MKVSKKLGYGINTLHMAAMAMACSRGPSKDKGNVISIVVSVDLRQYMEDNQPVFGNYVSIFFVRIKKNYWDDPQEVLRVIHEQMQTWVKRYKNKEMIYPFFIEKIYTMVGKKYYAWGARLARKKGLVSMSFAFSTLGKAFEIVNRNGQRAQICELRSIVPQYGLFMTSIAFDESTCNSISYPEAEYTHDEIVAFYHEYEKALDELLALPSDQAKA